MAYWFPGSYFPKDMAKWRSLWLYTVQLMPKVYAGGTKHVPGEHDAKETTLSRLNPTDKRMRKVLEVLGLISVLSSVHLSVN